MKIAFDYQTFTNSSYGGVSRYYKDLADQLLKQRQDVKIFAGIHRNHYITSLPSDIVNGFKMYNYPPRSSRIFHWFNHGLTQLQLRKWKPDIIHETYYSLLPNLKKNTIHLTTVHDMIHELYASLISTRDITSKLKKKSLSRVDHIMSNSENTKQDLVKLFGIDESKISVVHHAIDSSLYQNVVSNFDNSKKPYLLYVGMRDIYKNFSGFIKAVASSSLLMKDFDVIAVGARFNTAEKNLISSLGFANNQVKRISYVTDNQLAQFYKNAAAFVYPSLYEGFGLPPLEAMAAGCPVVCSNTSSMPEVVRNAGVYFNPLDIEDMSNAIERVVLSEDLKNKLVKLGYENIKNFTPSKTASKTLEVYRSLTGKI